MAIVALSATTNRAWAQSHASDPTAFSVIGYTKQSSGNWGDGFAAQLTSLRDRGYSIINLGQALGGLGSGGARSYRSVAIAFLDTEGDFESKALPLLKKLRFPFTVFLQGSQSDAFAALLKSNSAVTFGFVGSQQDAISTAAAIGLTGKPSIFFQPSASSSPVAGGDYDQGSFVFVKGSGKVAASSRRSALPVLVVGQDYDMTLLGEDATFSPSKIDKITVPKSAKFNGYECSLLGEDGQQQQAVISRKQDAGDGSVWQLSQDENSGDVSCAK